jgi:hypothetical protein
MTMTDVRAAALGEFPAPPPCPAWCTAKHDVTDRKRTVTWSRCHTRDGKWIKFNEHSKASVSLCVFEDYWGGRWQNPDPAELILNMLGGKPGDFHNGALGIDSSKSADVDGLVMAAWLISPKVHAAVLAAVQLLSSPEVTPAGEDQ